jgi:hypothetical protein
MPLVGFEPTFSAGRRPQTYALHRAVTGTGLQVSLQSNNTRNLPRQHPVCIVVFTLDAGLLAVSQYSEGPATRQLDTGFSWFPCVYKQMLRRFPRFQVATTRFSCSPPDLNLLITNFMYLYM